MDRKWTGCLSLSPNRHHSDCVLVTYSSLGHNLPDWIAWMITGLLGAGALALLEFWRRMVTSADV